MPYIQGKSGICFSIPKRVCAQGASGGGASQMAPGPRPTRLEAAEVLAKATERSARSGPLRARRGFDDERQGDER